MKKLTIFRTGAILFGLIAVFLMHSCQKESIEQTSSIAIKKSQHAFFDYDRMSKVNKSLDESTIIAGSPSPALRKIMSDFVKVEKEKPFADRLSQELGYPIWNAYQSFRGADGENVKLIPIARESDNILSAYLIASEKNGEYRYKLVRKSNLETFKVNEGENSLDYEYVLMTLAGLNELYFHEVDCSLKDNVKELIAANLGTEKIQEEESADSRNCYYVPVWSQQCVSVSQNGMTLCCKCHSVVSYHYICNEVAVIVENGNDGTNSGNGYTSSDSPSLAAHTGTICDVKLDDKFNDNAYYVHITDLRINWSHVPTGRTVWVSHNFCIQTHRHLGKPTSVSKIKQAFQAAVFTTEAEISRMQPHLVNNALIRTVFKRSLANSIGAFFGGGSTVNSSCPGVPRYRTTVGC